MPDEDPTASPPPRDDAGKEAAGLPAAQQILQAERAGRERAEKELASERFLLRTLMDTIPDHIYFKDLQSRFVRVNKAMAEWFGLSPEELRGRSDFDLFAEEHARDAFDDEQRLIRGGEPVVAKVEKETWPDGRVTWVSTTKMPIRDKDGKVVGTFGISRDVTAQRVAEEERDRYAAQIEADLKLARKVQEAFLPQEYPVLQCAGRAVMSVLRFSHRYLPTAALGGDFFEIVPLTGTRAGIFLCDVMGHGARSALVAAVVRGLVHEMRPSADDPGRFLTEINRALARDLEAVQTIFATGCYLTIDVENGQLRFASAGHPLPLWVRRSEQAVRRLAGAEADCGLALGLVEDACYPTAEHVMAPGDSMVLFTDGLYEVPDKRGEMYGTDRMVEAVRQRMAMSGPELLEALLVEARRFSATGTFEDDVCLVGMDFERKRPAPG